MPDGVTKPCSTYDLILASGPRLIEATHVPTGLRSRFATQAIFEEGRGWEMCDVDGKITGTILDSDLIDPVGLSVTRAQVAAEKRWSARAGGRGDAG